jgi:PilZ domain-containing protein
MWNARGSTVSQEKSTSNLHEIERRVDKRILVHVPVEVTELDGGGHTITERTFIEDVSDFGCRFSTRGPVKQGDTIAVKILGRYGNNLQDDAPRLYEIMWVAPKEHGSTVGARVLQGEKLANAKFPPENGWQKREPA